VRRYSLHVLSATGFGKSEPYDPAVEDQDSADGLSYKDALNLILENAVIIFALGPKLLTSPIRHILPTRWKLVGEATRYFRLHISNIIAEEKQNTDKHGGRNGNFINAMVRASEEERKINEGDSRDIRHSPNSLSTAEIHGNIFVYNFAGHDSTAITLTYALTHLAANPGVQDWIS
jgi:cytochrome P450